MLETVSTNVGFRQVEIRDTPASEDEFGKAGRYYYINGKTVKLRGVNRHETSPLYGHTVPREQMEEEIMLMKRANINHIRNSHYPEPTYLYYLADKYGIGFEDEANIESHDITTASNRSLTRLNGVRPMLHATWRWYAAMSTTPRS